MMEPLRKTSTSAATTTVTTKANATFNGSILTLLDKPNVHTRRERRNGSPLLTTRSRKQLAHQAISVGNVKRRRFEPCRYAPSALNRSRPHFPTLLWTPTSGRRPEVNAASTSVERFHFDDGSAVIVAG